MRPLIPLGPWRIMAEVARTRSLQEHPDLPARGCNCATCQNWQLVVGEVLSGAFEQQLSRHGLVASRPAELYVLDASASTPVCRATYYLVGEILEGPDPWRIAPDGTRGRQYVSWPNADSPLSLALNRQAEVGGREAWSAADVLQLDIVVPVPWRVAAPVA